MCSGASKRLVQIIFPTAFVCKCHINHNLNSVYRAHREQDHQISLGEFDQAYIFTAIVQVRNGVSALICISCCLSVCDETYMLFVYCREAAVQLVFMPVLKRHIKTLI